MSKSSRFLQLGLIFQLTACGDPSQFNEIPTGEAPIKVLKDAANSAAQPAGELEKISDQKTAEEGSPATVESPREVADATPNTVAVASQNAAGNSTPSVASNQSLSQETSGSSSAAPIANFIGSAAAAPSVTPTFDDCDASPDKNIVADLYELPANTKKLPDFNYLSSLRTVCIAQLNIADRNFTEGFPGVDNLIEWFALDMRFEVQVPSSGQYEFTLRSDDGAILWIDDNQVINNDGLHAVTEKSSKVNLSAGSHTFHVAYYQGPRMRIALELLWKKPGSNTKTHIPSSAISRP